ncbi:MAG: cytochrome c1, partial [Campylobacter sp.]|nr:cytochrome c1 [Campylobacter sp.]
SKLNPKVDPANYDFAAEDIAFASSNLAKAEANLENAEKAGLEDIIKNAKNEVSVAKNSLEGYTAFWKDVENINLKAGDPVNGELAYQASCMACHGLEAAGMPAFIDEQSGSEIYGVNPPDLSTAGKIYDDKFLAAIIKNPVMAMKLDHKFDFDYAGESIHPMTPFYGAGTKDDPDAEIADIIAYLNSVAPKELSSKQLFIDACSRCHDMKYDEIYVGGNRQSLNTYMGMTPPDLSMYIRSRSKDYLHNFINDTQKMLVGTSMPRVGLSLEAENQIVEYMQSVGDSKKAVREKTSIYIMIYFAILAVLAGLWKRKIWRDL